MHRIAIAATLLAAALPALAAPDIFRCQSRGGGVSYQQAPCDDDAVGGLSGIASDYPPVNVQAREGILAREAAMYQRLEAQRERLSREAMVRTASKSVEPESAVEPQFMPVIVAMRPSRAWRHSRDLAIRR